MVELKNHIRNFENFEDEGSLILVRYVTDRILLVASDMIDIIEGQNRMYNASGPTPFGCFYEKGALIRKKIVS